MIAHSEATGEVERSSRNLARLRITASDLYTLYSPSECELRIWLRERNELESEPTEFEQVLRRLGRRHEEAHLATFPEVTNVRTVSFDQRFKHTKTLVKDRTKVLYQPVLQCLITIAGIDCEIIGEPDFLILDAEHYVIRDVKLVRQVDKDQHPEVILQIQLYSWIYERVFGISPKKLEILNGKNELVTIPPDSASVVAHLRRIMELKLLTEAPYSPVGWTKCDACGFHDLCWGKAKESADVALVYGVDQVLAIGLHRRGIRTIDDLIVQLDEATLAEVRRPWGDQMQRVGKSAHRILLSALALLADNQINVASPTLPESENFVVCDWEGLPPYQHDLNKVYLWGTAIFGESPRAFQAAVAGFGDGGDEQGWWGFLNLANEIFHQQGDLPWLHWAAYERTQLNEYIRRYGDPKGIAARVLKNLTDLLPIARDSIVLPVHSYGLKAVEKYLGFKRTQTDYGGSWSMARYIEATETQSEQFRREIMSEILKYNEEDILATWKVFKFLMDIKNKSSSLRHSDLVLASKQATL